MNFNIGDKVRFLNEKGEGTVTKVINKTTVAVTIEDGFEIPCLMSNLVLIQDKKNTKQKEITFSEPVITSTNKVKESDLQKKEEGIYIAFSPINENNLSATDFNVWLINHSPYKIMFSYSLFQNNIFNTIETGVAGEFENYLLETIERKILEDFLNFKIDVIFYNEKEHEAQSPISEIIKLKPVKLVRDNVFIKNSLIPEKALVLAVALLNQEEHEVPATKLNSIDLSQLLFQKQKNSDTKKRSKPHAVNNGLLEMEIDLHIEELMDNYSGMTNSEIIQIQLKHFQKYLDKAITERYKKIIVIHGIGNGRLKQEVRAIVASYDKLRFYDASYSKYGFGATEIVIS